MKEEAGREAGLLGSLRGLAKTFLAVLQTRLEIVASELEEEKVRLGRIALLAALAAFCLGLAVNLLVFFLVVVFWDQHRLLAIGVLMGVFGAGGLTACWLLRAAISQRPRLLSVTLAELDKDRKGLEGR